MKTLLHASDNQELIQRIHRLRPDMRPTWGKMNAAQMLAHCQVPLCIAAGELKLPRRLLGLLLGGLAKKQLVADKPFKKNLPTDKAFRVSGARDFAIEKANLLALVQRFGQRGPEGITKEPHPFFGKLSVPEWETLQWKHLDHHLRQFGA